MNTRQHLFSAIADGEFSSRVMLLATQLDWETHTFTTDELLESPDGAKADCVVLQLEAFDAIAAHLIDECRRRSPQAPILAVLTPQAMEEAAKLTRFGIFECISLSSTD